MNCELPDVQAGFRKDRGTRGQIANICQIIEKAREFQKSSTPASLTMLKPLTVWITTNWKILEQMGKYYFTCLLRTLQADQEETELDIEQQTGSKLGKEYVKAIYCHLAYLTYMQSTSRKMLG